MAITKYECMNAADVVHHIKTIVGDAAQFISVQSECGASGKITLVEGQEKYICSKRNLVSFFAKHFNIDVSASESSPLVFVYTVPEVVDPVTTAKKLSKKAQALADAKAADTSAGVETE